MAGRSARTGRPARTRPSTSTATTSTTWRTGIQPSNTYHHDGIHCYTHGHRREPITSTAFYIYNNRFDGDNGATQPLGLPRRRNRQQPQHPLQRNASSKIRIFNNVMTSTEGPITNNILSTLRNGNVFVANNTIDVPTQANSSEHLHRYLPRACTSITRSAGATNSFSGVRCPGRVDYNTYGNCRAVSTASPWAKQHLDGELRHLPITGSPRSTRTASAAYSVATGSNAAAVARTLRRAPPGISFSLLRHQRKSPSAPRAARCRRVSEGDGCGSPLTAWAPLASVLLRSPSRSFMGGGLSLRARLV